MVPPPLSTIAAVPVAQLAARLGWDAAPLQLSAASLAKPLTRWKMQDDDQPILRYLYRHHAPRRHLELGTWRGEGACMALEESPATVWTINLLEGETKPDGTPAYWGPRAADDPAWANCVGDRGVQTDALGFIGSEYRRRGLGHRVCQVYSSTTQWDTASYPPGFFDSVLIDAAHDADTVTGDTRKVLPLVRAGGLVLWHDFCPAGEVYERCDSTRGVMDAVAALLPELRPRLRDLFWVEPSWLLVGVRGDG